MRNVADYSLNLSESGEVAAHAELVFERVWRFDFTQPGFCLIDLGPGVDSHALRSGMLQLKQRLSDLCRVRTGQAIGYRSLGRFDQQETTRFHLDGAPDQSLLVLGYEPSPVRSRLFLADYTRCAFDLGITPAQFLTDFNPMFAEGERRLAGYITALPSADAGRAQVLLINNSSLPLAAERRNPLGVMHKAEILNPTSAERRIVNSIMLAVDASGEDAVGLAAQQEFVRTEALSAKVVEPAPHE